MKRVRRRRLAKIVAVSCMAVFAALAACSNQAEGERCEIDNGNDDCQDGLVCTPIANQNGARCCPPDRAQATTGVCQQQVQVPNGDAEPSADTGPSPDVSVPDTGADADAEASTPDAADADADDGDADGG